MKLCETYYKFNLVIITSFCQSKNLDSFRLPLRRLWRKYVKHLKLNHSDRIFSEFRSHFRLHIQWNPFPTPQRQDHQKEGRTSCLWKKDSFIFQNILSCCFLKPEQPNVETTSGTDQLSLIRHIKLVARQRGQDVAATECFCIFFRYLGFYLHSVGSLSHALKAALM